MSITSFLTATAGGLLALGLLGPTVQAQNGALGLSSIVSTRDPNLQVPAGARLAWRESSIKIYQDPAEAIESADTLLRGAIESAMQAKGYRWVASGEPVDFELGFLLALGDGLDDQQILRQFGFNPGLRGGAGQPDKGTLVVILIHPGSGRSMWRGAIQAFVTREAEVEKRQRRAQAAASKLLELMPDAR